MFLIPNAANCEQVVALLAEAAPDGVTVTNQHRDFAVLAVQGTLSDEVVSGAGLPAGHDYMTFARNEYQGTPVTVCRTGYTGERGYELVVPVGAAVAVWDAVLAAGEPYGLQPAGLGARDTLRTEMGYPLHGQDLSPAITPVQARLGGQSDGEGIILRSRGTPRRDGSRSDAPATRTACSRPRHSATGMVVRVPDGREVGTVTPAPFHRPSRSA